MRKIGEITRPVLTLRKHPRWGTMQDKVEPNAYWPGIRPSNVVLIHGYNVNFSKAKNDYDTFFKQLKTADVSEHFISGITTFYWPGNANLGILSTGAYPIKIYDAIDAAEKLSSFLEDHFRQYPKVQLAFVAHSLGCRLILEAISNILQKDKSLESRIRRTTLMAAAVPISMVKYPGSRLYDIRDSTIPLSGLHSMHDMVLLGAFPVGQLLGIDGMLRGAVGFWGWPKALWTDGDFRLKIGHGDYWSNAMATQFLAHKFGIPLKRIFNENEIFENKLAVYLDTWDQREPPGA